MEQQPTQHITDKTDKFLNIVKINFADSKIPVFKESRNMNIIKCGEDNLYPDHLLELYNKSAKHNALINGKAFYVFGNGFENGDITINRLDESLNDVAYKCIVDMVLYGGYRIEVIYNAYGDIIELYHVEFNNLRQAKDGGFLYNQNWTKFTRDEDCVTIEAFNPDKPVGTQIYAYNLYRPKTRYYPLPDYVGCLNYIETDIEISKYYLSSIKNGMVPSKMIQMFNGEPTDEEKIEIKKRFKREYTGSENAGKFLIIFNTNKDKSVEVTDLSATELDKLFTEMNQTVQQEMYAGHGVTSPMLFGIKTEGQLGGNNELKTAYSLFQNTYAKPRAKGVSKDFTYLLSFSIFNDLYTLRPTDPVGVQIDIKDVINSMPKEFVFTQLGIPKELWNLENVGSDNKATPTVPVNPQPDVTAIPVKPGQPQAPNAQPGVPAATSVNDNIKNLTGRQQQTLERWMKAYQKGRLTYPQAKALMQAGLGLSDTEIDILLGVTPAVPAPTVVAASKFEDDNDVEETISVFDSFGDLKDDYEILKSKKVNFSIEEIQEDENIYITQAFKTYDVTSTESKILSLIQKDNKITPKAIGQVIGQSEVFVVGKIKSLIQKGYIEEHETLIGEDTIIERMIPDGIDITKPPVIIDNMPISQVKIMYSYEGPSDSRNRPFCAKLISLNRMFSRADIETISKRLGYSVFDRRGGFWRHKDGSTTPYCRHRWQANIVVKK